MRERLSKLITEYAETDPRVIVLSGDHGYALFDPLRKSRPDQFLNVGVAEQNMIGVAAGLARTGFRPIAYGLAAFLPIRVLEQIKLDLCLSRLPVLLLGDGAGLVYSTLGSSHQCGEDVAALRPMPGITIYSPADATELEACFRSSMDLASGPSYLRIGKSDRPQIHAVPVESPDYAYTHRGNGRVLLIGTGSMASAAQTVARKAHFDSVSVMRIKPLPKRLISEATAYEQVVVLEEHHRAGGLYSAIAEAFFSLAPARYPRMHSLSLKDQFSEKCGSHDYALSEHGLGDDQIERRIREITAV